MSEPLFGVYVAVVVDNKLDDRSRITVRIDGISDKEQLARIATLQGGDGYGLQFLPEKGDQVVVVFERGFVGDAIVIGCLWSRKAKAPDANGDGGNLVKLIRTKAGNEIRLFDKDGEERIEITCKHEISIKGSKITLDGDVVVTGDTAARGTLAVGPDGSPKTTISGNEIKGG